MQKRAELDGQRRATIMLFYLAYVTEYVAHESGRITHGYSAVVF